VSFNLWCMLFCL